ncbi:MAG: SBBP repeat-containing protein [Bacteroidota bacterium]
MFKQLFLAIFLIVCFQNIFASNITKPVSSQFGFIENKGQIIDQNNHLNPSVLYLYNGNGLHVQLKQTGFSYEVWKLAVSHQPLAVSKSTLPEANSQELTADTTFIHRINISFVNANQNIKIISSDIAPDYINYYTTGTSEAGVINVHHYKKVLYQNIYNNIDVEFVLNDERNCGNFKYNFIVKPGGNVNDIQLKFDGANNTSLTTNGHILIETAYGNIDESIPYSYQLNESNQQQSIDASFIINNSKLDIYGIGVDKYDATKTLIIDPTAWATYFGGSGNDQGNDIATDTSGSEFITGFTGSTTAIATSGAYQTTFAGGTYDAFIAKFNSYGARLWSTYYGGSGADYGQGISVDVGGNVLITGYTSSSSSIATSGAFQTTFGGGNDAFIIKINTSGTLQWASYYGGGLNDIGRKITTDQLGNIFLVGGSNSSSGIATSGSFQSAIGGSYAGWDGFIVKFNSTGSRQWATYYGGGNDDDCNGIALDSYGNIYITGNTMSGSGIATSGSYQSSYTFNIDSYIAKFDSTGGRQWSTYYGGGGTDYPSGIVSDLLGNIFTTGRTNSTTGIASSGAFQTVFAGGTWDAYIVKFNSSGALQWGSYYGGSNDDYSNGIAKDISGNILITGYTLSTSGITTTGVYQSIFISGCGNDAFIVKFNSSGVRQWGTYYGTCAMANGIVSASSGNILITGNTVSNTAIATSGAYQTTFGGGTTYGDAFIAVFTSAGGLPIKLTSFDATLENKNVLCTWQTASESNNDYFEIQRSVGGSQPACQTCPGVVGRFTAIGKVKGNGTTNIVSSYQFIDVSTPLDKTGTLYYRLKQVDFDGKSTFSDVRVVTLNQVNNEITIYPNPTNDVLNISFAQQSSSTTIQLFDITGRIVKIVNTLNNNNQIDVSDLCNGIYFINICSQKINVSRKIMIYK